MSVPLPPSPPVPSMIPESMENEYRADERGAGSETPAQAHFSSLTSPPSLEVCDTECLDELIFSRYGERSSSSPPTATIPPAASPQPPLTMPPQAIAALQALPSLPALQSTQPNSGGNPYSDSLKQENNLLQLRFGSGSEQKVLQWPALVQAYNMKHPEQTPVLFVFNDAADAYEAHGKPEVLAELHLHLHNELPKLAKTSGTSLPNIATQEQQVSPSRN